jgi:voltage-gated potassium channel
MEQFHRAVRLLYTGTSERARRFRYGLIVFNAASIVYFIATAALPATPAITALNAVLGVVILLDFAARMWIAPNRRRELLQVHTIADLIVVGSLLLAPLLAENLGFLRVLRGLRLIRSYHLLRDLRSESLFFRRHEDAILAGANTAARRAGWYSRNNPWVAAAVDSLVGAGIKPQYSHSDHAALDGLADFSGLRDMAVRAMVESG